MSMRRTHRIAALQSNFCMLCKSLSHVVHAAKSQVEVIGHAIDDSGKFVIPAMVVEDETLNLALCCRLHDLSIFESSPESEIVECEVGNKVKSGVKLDSKLFLRG